MKKDIILFVNHVSAETLDGLKSYSQTTGEVFRVAVIRDSKKKQWEDRASNIGVDIFLQCDLNNPVRIAKSLQPYKDHIAAVTCRAESSVQWLSTVVPHVPYVRTPTSQSLEWSTDKVLMRELFRIKNPKITPKFLVITDSEKETLNKVKAKVGFPLVLKPAGLAQSLLVSVCFHEEELESNLKKLLKKLKKVYRENKRTNQPKILVEQFMEGEMYSVDTYVSSRGHTYSCPLVHVKTGRSVGFDDFFGYQRMLPTTLGKGEVEKAQKVADASIHALGLRNVTAHVELLKTDNGWKVIEVGPRIGGFRHRLYQLAYGIDHSLNDILIRLGRPVEIPKKKKGYAAVLQFYAKKEGRLKTLKGLKKVTKLKSFVEIKQYKKIGDLCRFAKHGGKAVCNVVLFNKNRSELLADIRRLEQMIIIETKR